MVNENLPLVTQVSICPSLYHPVHMVKGQSSLDRRHDYTTLQLGRDKKLIVITSQTEYQLLSISQTEYPSAIYE